MINPFPPHIAICGHPGAGKSEVQRILNERFDYLAIDDGHCLRQFAVDHIGLEPRQVYTQEGKRETVQFAGKDWTVRDLLGQLGNHIETLLGPHAIPEMAVMRAEKEYPHPWSARFSYGSVRRDQGIVYKKHGGIVVGVRRPDVGPSVYEFDRFDASLVDIWIDNDGAIEDLDTKIVEIFQHYALTKAA